MLIIVWKGEKDGKYDPVRDIYTRRAFGAVHGCEYYPDGKERGAEQVAYPYSLSFGYRLRYLEHSAYRYEIFGKQYDVDNRMRDRAGEHTDFVLALGTSGEQR